MARRYYGPAECATVFAEARANTGLSSSFSCFCSWQVRPGLLSLKPAFRGSHQPSVAKSEECRIQLKTIASLLHMHVLCASVMHMSALTCPPADRCLHCFPLAHRDCQRSFPSKQMNIF